MSTGPRYVTQAEMETAFRKLRQSISGAGITTLPPVIEGVESYADLDDVDGDYSGHVGNIPTVNAAEDGLEWNPYVLASATAPTLTIRNATDAEVDPIIQLALGASPVIKYTLGVDDSVTGDPFKLSSGSALGTTDMMILEVGESASVTLGYRALNAVPGTLSSAVTVGADALYNATNVSDSVALGFNVGYRSTASYQSVLVGAECYGIAVGQTGYTNRDVWIGRAAGNTGQGFTQENVIIGYAAGQSFVSDPYVGTNHVQYNVVIGSQAGTYLKAVDGIGDCEGNIFIGYQAGYSNSVNRMTGSENTGTGYLSLQDVTTAYYNTAYGSQAGKNITSGDNNVVIGYLAGNVLTTQGGNVFLGTRAGQYETGSNTFFVDNQDRTNEATARTNALIYGTFAALPADQDLNLNADVVISGTLTVGGVTVSPNHNILSATHGDSTAAAVTRGAMIAGIGATPKWTVVAAGTEGYAWIMGANEPGWASLSFVDLDDVPAAYTGAGGKVVKVKVDETGLEFVAGGAGVASFVDLDDVPASYVGQEGLYVRVNAAADGLEFAAGGGSGAPTDAKYIVQEANGDLSAEQSLGALATGIVKNTTTAGVGVLSIAAAGTDYLTTAAPTDAKYIVGLANATLSAEKVKPQLYNNYDIDDTPAAPNALDDEFDDSSLDVKWTAVNNPATRNWDETTYAGFLSSIIPETAATDNFDNHHRFYQAMPGGNIAVTIIAKVSLAATGCSGEDAEWASVGIYFGNPTDDQMAMMVVEFNNATAPAPHGTASVAWVRGYKWGASGALAALATDYFQGVPVAGWVYVKLEKPAATAWTSAQTYNFYYSLNGVTWHQTGTDSLTFTTAPTEIGIYCRPPKAQAGTPVSYPAVDFFRRIV